MTQASRVIGYVRVSTREQAEEGISLEAQRAKLEAYADALELELVAVVEDAGVSATSLDRPGLQEALQRLSNSEADGLLVVKLDRLTRSVRDLGELLEQYSGARFSLLSVADSIDTRSAAGRLVLNVLGSVAQWEREATGERTRDALAHLKRQGRYTGGSVPYGYRLGPDRTLVPHRAEQAVIAKSRELERTHTIRAIAVLFECDGIVSRTGKPFAPMQIARMLREA